MGRGPQRAAELGKKWCPGCNASVDVSLFTFQNKAKGILTAYCKVHDAERRKRHYDAHTQEMIDRQDKYNYGLSDSTIRQQLYKQQNGLCAICQRPEKQVAYGKPRRLALDHCHTSGKVRSLLCADCNRALGAIEEDPERAKALLKYIEERCL